MFGRGAGSIAVLAALIVLLLLGGRGPEGSGTSGGGEPGAPLVAPVLRVVDGDTIVVGIGGGSESVRYIGVDTPETVKPDTPVQCYGPQASERNHQLVEGQTVRLEFDRERRDVYGRLLAYVFVGKRFVNGALVADGFARTLAIEPNTSRAGELGRLESRAADTGRGLWGAC